MIQNHLEQLQKSVPGRPPDSIASSGHEASGLYDFAAGHSISGTSSSANSKLNIGSSAK